MKHRGRLLEVLHRAETGPLIDEKAFERQLVAQTSKRLINEYGIQYDPKMAVEANDDLADRLFQAGLDFAVEVGVFCQDTSRRITWTRKEYEDALRHCPSQALMGEGRDAVMLHARTPEDLRPPAASGGPVGVIFPETMFVEAMAAYAREPVIDILEPGTLETAYGHTIKGASAWEAVAGWREAELCHETLRRVGRPGMPLACVTLAAGAVGHISPISYGGFRPSDWHHCAVIAEFKTNHELLSKIAHAVFTDGNIEAFYTPIFGGFLGGAEGIALGLTAGLIVLHQNYMGTTMSVNCHHPILGCSSTPEIVWAKATALQAASRNTNLITGSMNRSASGPGTKTILYENAALAIGNSVSGISLIEGCQSASGINNKHASPLEAKINAEAGKAAAGMRREDANALVLKLLANYTGELEKKPIGKPFDEVYDLRTLKPTAEWEALYEEVRAELIELGLPLDRLR